MIKKRRSPRLPRRRLKQLGGRLEDAHDTVRVIRAGEVNALVVDRAGDDEVITVQRTDLPYRMLLDQMFAGAVTMTTKGLIVYCNRRFAEIVRTPRTSVIGSTLSRFVPSVGRPGLSALLAPAQETRTKGQLTFRASDGTRVPVSVTFAPLRLDENADISGVIGVVVDDTERRRQEELRRLLIEQVMAAQDDERGRIARELHDETGQALAALLMGLRTIEEARTMAEAVKLAQQMREVAARTLHDVGRLARGLHPAVLDELGLAVAVTRHVQEFARLHSIAQDTLIEGLDGEPMLPLLQNTIYRVLQEALTNIAKHASAGRVSVHLVREKTTVELSVRDDGVGFKPAATHRGLGLQGMRERAALLGGAVEFKSAPGKGTQIMARFPVRRR